MTETYAPDMHGTTDTASLEAEPAAWCSLRDELRAATHAEHQDLENHMDLMRPGFGLKDYGRLLLKYHGFYDAFERFLLERAGGESVFAVFYCRDRLKKAWLAGDLDALGIDISAYTEALPQARLRALFPSEQRLLGAIYVIEGSMLGGSVLSKQFRKRFDMTPETGLRFFTGYGAATREKWLATLQLLAAFDRHPESRSEIIEGARSTFLLFKEHLVAG